MKRILILALLITLTGCGRQTTPEVTGNDQTISMQAWSELEVYEKYAPEMLTRLRRSDPKLVKPENWDRFMRRVVVPERRKDIPTDY